MPGVANQNPGEPTKRVCPGHAGGNRFWPSTYSQKTKLLYIPTLSNCEDISINTAKHSKEKGWNGGSFKTTERYESNLTSVDPVTGEIKKSVHMRYPNYSGALSTGGGLVFNALLDGTIAAYDDTTLDELWKFNAGSGFHAPPMTFEVNASNMSQSPPARARRRSRGSSTRRNSRSNATRRCFTYSGCKAPRGRRGLADDLTSISNWERAPWPLSAKARRGSGHALTARFDPQRTYGQKMMQRSNVLARWPHQTNRRCGETSSNMPRDAQRVGFGDSRAGRTRRLTRRACP